MEVAPTRYAYRRWGWFAIRVACLVLLLTACGSNRTNGEEAAATHRPSGMPATVVPGSTPDAAPSDRPNAASTIPPLSATPEGSAPTPGAPQVALITFKNGGCDPSELTVTVGTEVYVENDDSAPVTWQSDQGFWNFTIAPGARKGLDMLTAGTYPFHCNASPGTLHSQAQSSKP